MQCTKNVKLSFCRCLLSFFAITLYANSSLASEWDPRTDLKLGLNGRTYPAGAQIAASLGIGQALWGDPDGKTEKGKQNWKYGYTRLAINGATSVVVNRIGMELQFYPISILGFGVGYDRGVRNFTPKAIDCSNFECNGTITRKFLRMQLLAASHGLVLSLTGRYEELRAPDANLPFFDEMTLLVGQSAGEQVLSWTPVLLYGISDQWQAGAAILYNHALDTGGDSLLYGPVVGYKPCPDWTILSGIGLNRSPVVHSALAGFFVIQWMFKDGLALTDRIASGALKPILQSDI